MGSKLLRGSVFSLISDVEQGPKDWPFCLQGSGEGAQHFSQCGTSREALPSVNDKSRLDVLKLSDKTGEVGVPYTKLATMPYLILFATWNREKN